jgi:large subunit ribosomal protein L13
VFVGPSGAGIFPMKTYSPKPEHIERRWYVLDANGQVLGRLASEVATLLRGKHKPMFAPHMDTGDHVIVINADKVELTGNKLEDKIAWRHSGYPGGITGVKYGDLMATRPVAAVEKAVRGMLPKNRIGRQMIKKLHIVAGPEHPHGAQKPVPLAVGERPAWDGLPVPATAPTPTAPKASRPASKPDAPAPRKKPTAEPAPKPVAPAEDVAEEAAEAAPKPAAKKTTAKKPTAKKPTAKKPTAKATSAAKKPTAKKTTAKKPTAKKTTAKKPPKSEE